MSQPQAFAVGLQFPSLALVSAKVFLPKPLHVVADVMAESRVSLNFGSSEELPTCV